MVYQLVPRYTEAEGNADGGGLIDPSVVKETLLGVKAAEGTEMLRSALAHALATFPLNYVLPSRRPPPPTPELPRPKIPLRNYRESALRMAVGAHKAAEEAALAAAAEAAAAEQGDDALEIVTEK